MTAIVIILIVIALIVGIGALLEGLAWMFLITVGLLALAAVFGARAFGRR
jgi:hypothetical protein